MSISPIYGDFSHFPPPAARGSVDIPPMAKGAVFAVDVSLASVRIHLVGAGMMILYWMQRGVRGGAVLLRPSVPLEPARLSGPSFFTRSPDGPPNAGIRGAGVPIAVLSTSGLRPIR